MKLSRRASTAAVLATVALGGTLAATAPATAATTAAYNGACGTGYQVKPSTPVKSSQTSTIGTVYVTYSTATNKLCAVTIRNTPGARTFMEVTLDVTPSSGDPARDSGSYTTYAGPVYRDAPKPGECVAWSGSIDIYYNSDTGLCS